jgi:predicted CoA-substrate-specific enzyme activase
MRVGIDIGSTTIKCVVLNDEGKLVHSTYTRHFSHIKENLLKVLLELQKQNLVTDETYFGMSGSAGMGIADALGIEFVQEVYATRIAAQEYLHDVDCIIELGGEDAKILFMKHGLEVRMNGTCAGGTGAFIDQMATLLNISIQEMNDMALKHNQLYTIASRCGVFAKTDIQALLNQGASKEDVSASIFKSVVNQTIGGLAQGREIKGNIVYLGGPLTFIPALRKSFDESLHTEGISPENSLYYVALGSSLCSHQKHKLEDIIATFNSSKTKETYAFNEPLFKDEKELEEFRIRHAKAKVDTLPLENYTKPLYLGVDSGSTTLKVVLIDGDKNIRYTKYLPNKGKPLNVFDDILKEIYSINPNANIKGTCSTGYGEDLIKNAFSLDDGIVETVAHFKAAKHFSPNVDFIIDIGGQDIKCFKIDNGVISNIFLNEACSSGCGSFLQTFAQALGYSIEDFAKIGLLAKKPVDLGSRCTVFMNSSVKQAQKDGATIENISAGLSMSVVKNAIYKVIRVSDPKLLGKNIVVQGGTFYNEAVLRAFEKELGVNVIRPNISGIAGAYGAALHARALRLEKSSLISLDEINNFSFKTTNFTCQGCSNHCALTMNKFSNGKAFISGNKCEKPITKKATDTSLDIYAYIQDKLMSYKPIKGRRGTLGIPLVLNNYELWPFWYTFFTSLGYEVHNSGFSSAKLYTLGQHTIPSDTACFPAKLVHGHIEKLLNEGYDVIFYPCMTYNVKEGISSNNYNCPVVAYYPETIKNNISRVNDVNFIRDYFALYDEKIFSKKILEILNMRIGGFNKKEIKEAASLAYKEYENYMQSIRDKGQEIIQKAREQGKRIFILAGRPYHVDPEVNHGIDKLILGFNSAIISEDSVSHLNKKFATNVLNQWTYHARLYSAAKYASDNDDINLIQLVSFGCGIDAITTDETKKLLESNGKIYTQIKIDEITNLGAVKIRIRSLLAALDGKEKGLDE